MSGESYKLRIKLKSLAAEARIIRREELKLKARNKESRDHLAHQALPKIIMQNPVKMLADPAKGDVTELMAEPMDYATAMKLARRKVGMTPAMWSRVNRKNAMREHRIKEVRSHSRATHLAYGFIRGKKRSTMEQIAEFRGSVYTDKLVRDFVVMVAKYCDSDGPYWQMTDEQKMQNLCDWLNEVPFVKQDKTEILISPVGYRKGGQPQLVQVPRSLINQIDDIPF